MILEFKLEEFDDIQEEYEAIFGEADYSDTEEQSGIVYTVKDFRVVIPDIESSFRYAIANVRNEDIEDENEEGAWEADYDCYLSYAENEKDVNKWQSATTNELAYAVLDVAEGYGYDSEDIWELDCYIDTSEFISPEREKEILPENWQEMAKEDYPELFKAIEGFEYDMHRGDGYYYAKLFVSNRSSNIEFLLGKKNFYLNIRHNSNTFYAENCGTDRTKLATNIKIVENFIKGKVFFIKCDIPKHYMSGIVIDSAEAEKSDQELFKLVINTIPEDLNLDENVKMKCYFWDDTQNREAVIALQGCSDSETMEIKEALVIAYEFQEKGLEAGYFKRADELYTNPELMKYSEITCLHLQQTLSAWNKYDNPNRYDSNRLLNCVMRFCFYAGAGAYCMWIKNGFAKDPISLISDLAAPKGVDCLDEYVTELLNMRFGDPNSKKLDRHIFSLIPILGTYSNRFNDQDHTVKQIVQCMMSMYDYGIFVARQLMGN